MKSTLRLSTLAFIIIFSSFFIACSSDDDAPVPINAEEVITTLTATLVPADGMGATITLTTRDLDGDGPDEPVVTVSGNLDASTTYSGTLVLLNETVSPADNITLEVEEEDDEHQFFFTANGGLDVATTYTSFDDNSNPLGITFDLTTGAASTGAFTVTLRHEPTKPNTGLTDAGGETDISASFTVTIQ